MPGQKPSNPGIILSADHPEQDQEEQQETLSPTLSASGEAQAAQPPRNPLDRRARTPGAIEFAGDNEPKVDDTQEEEFPRPEITDAEVLAGLVPGKLQPIAEPKYLDYLFDPNSAEDLTAMLRLHQLNNQVATQELRSASKEHLTQSISKIAQQSDEALIKNLTKQATRTRNEEHFRPDHYSPKGFELLSIATENIHRGLTTSQEDNKTIITLPPIKIKDMDGSEQEISERTVTTWPDKDKQRIMISASGTDVYSLVVLIEKALKTAKAMYPTKASFVIFIPPKNQDNIKVVAQLCAMANFVGLTPIFQTKDGCTIEYATKFQEKFIQDIGRPETINCSFLTNKQESFLTQRLNELGLNPTYKPPEYKKLNNKP